MRATDMLHLAIADLGRHRRRMIPALAGITVGVVLLVTVLTIMATILQVSTHDILQQGSLHQITVTQRANGVAAVTLNPASITRFLSVPHAVAAYPLTRVELQGELQTVVFDVSLASEPSVFDRPRLLEGRWAASPNEIVLPNVPPQTGSTITDPSLPNLAVLYGKMITVGGGTSGGAYSAGSRPNHAVVHVVGIYRAPQNWDNVTPPTYTSLATVYHFLAMSLGQSDADLVASMVYPAVIVDVDLPQNTAQVANLISELGYTVSYLEQNLTGLSRRVVLIETLALITVFIIIVAAVAAIGSALTASFVQQRHNIGVMLAVGFTQRSIMGVMMVEGVLVGAMGSLIGIAITGIGMIALSKVKGVTLDTPWWGFPTAFGSVILLALAASWLSSRRVLRLDVVQSLREG